MEQALVIGASGGIGSALADELSVRGMDVTRLSRSRDGFDVRDPQAVVEGMARLDGPYRVVFIALGTLAAGGAPEKALAQIEAGRMAQVLAVNTIGPALVLAQLPRLLPRDGAACVGVLSARVGSIGDNQLGGWYSYRASKAALNQVVRSAAVEFGRSHRQAVIAALHPGTVETNFTKNYQGHDKVSATEAARNLCDVLTGLHPAQSGGFFDYAGKEIVW